MTIFVEHVCKKKKSIDNSFSFFGKVVQPPSSVKILMDENK